MSPVASSRDDSRTLKAAAAQMAEPGAVCHATPMPELGRTPFGEAAAFEWVVYMLKAQVVARVADTAATFIRLIRRLEPLIVGNF